MMSESMQIQVIPRQKRNEHNAGNQYAKLPYDAKLIRDSLKENIYRAVAGLNMTSDEAHEYYNRPGVTVLEQMFYKAMIKDNWQVFEAFMGRTIGPQIQKYLHENLAPPEPDLSKLSTEEIKTLSGLNAKINSSNE